MPNYSFKNKDSGECFDIDMKISERDQYIKDHPELEQVLKPLRTVDPYSAGVTKPPSDFTKYVLGKVKEKTPGATEVGTRRFSIPREW